MICNIAAMLRDLEEARPYIEIPAAGWAARRAMELHVSEVRHVVANLVANISHSN